VSKARAAYRLRPTDGVGKCHAATLGPNVSQGYLRTYPRAGGIPGKLRMRKGLRPTVRTRYRLLLGVHLRVAGLVGEKPRDRLPPPAVPREPTSGICATCREVLPQYRSG